MAARRGVSRVFVCGLATDYCVRAPALDALQEAFETFVLTDAVHGANVQPDDRLAIIPGERWALAHW